MVVGLVFKCRNNRYVKIQGSGSIQEPSGLLIDGFVGHEIDNSGKDLGNWLYWNTKGNSTRDRRWDLIESNAGADPLIAQGRGWPSSK